MPNTNHHTLTAAEMNELAHYPMNQAKTVVKTEDGMVYVWNGSAWESDGVPAPTKISFSRRPRSFYSARRYGR